MVHDEMSNWHYHPGLKERRGEEHGHSGEPGHTHLGYGPMEPTLAQKLAAAKRYDVVLRYPGGGTLTFRTLRLKDPAAALVRWQQRVDAHWAKHLPHDPVPGVELWEAPERWSISQVGPGRGRDSRGRYTGYSADTREGLAIAASKRGRVRRF